MNFMQELGNQNHPVRRTPSFARHSISFGKWARLSAALLVCLVSLTSTAPVGAAPVLNPVDASLARAAACFGDTERSVAIRGFRKQRFTTDVRSRQSIDATTALWLQVGNWPIALSGGRGACWYGGRIFGTFPQDTAWDEFHHTGAMSFHNPDLSVVGLRVHNYGDAIDVVSGARNFRIRDAHLSFIHDDCVQNDQLYSGVLEDSFLDGCYVALSARPADGEHGDGRANTWIVRDSVIRLEPMPTVYKGHAPGHGGFFKWDEHGRGPRIVVRNTVFRADQRPNHQTLGLPKGYRVTCSNNTMVWLGKGRFPDRLPRCFHVTKDRRVWDAAVQRWNTAHPLNP